MRPHIFCLIGTLLVSAPIAAHPDATDFGDCTPISDANQRLACYDKLAQRDVSDESNQADSYANGLGLSESSQKSDEESARAAEFGATDLPASPVDELEARIVGDFVGWSGRTRFVLDNGQIWQQTNNYIRPYSPQSPIAQAKITIRKGLFGSYTMRVEGVKRIVQVKRIK